MRKVLKGADGGTLRFGLALRLEQRIINPTNVAHQLLVLLRVGLAAQIFVQSLLGDRKANSWNLSDRLRDCNRRYGDWTSRGVQVDVATWNRASRGKCAQLARPDGEIQRGKKFCGKQIRVKAGIVRRFGFCRGLSLPVDVELGPFGLAIVGARQFDRSIQGEYVLGSLLPWRCHRQRQ